MCSVVLAIFAAYAISRYRFRGRSAFTLTVLSTQMFPGILFLLPLFVIFVNLERSTGVALYGTRLGLIITYLTFSLPFSIWMLVGYFDSIPRELEQAALVDGSHPARRPVSDPHPRQPARHRGGGHLRLHHRLGRGALRLDADHGLHAHARHRPTQLPSQSNVYWNQLMAAAIVVSAPVVIAFLALQRYIVRGLTSGGVK